VKSSCVPMRTEGEKTVDKLHAWLKKDPRT
jgi:hypothetical protein